MSNGKFFSAAFLFLVITLYQHLKSNMSAAATTCCYSAQGSTHSVAINSTPRFILPTSLSTMLLLFGFISGSGPRTTYLCVIIIHTFSAKRHLQFSFTVCAINLSSIYYFSCPIASNHKHASIFCLISSHICAVQQTTPYRSIFFQFFRTSFPQ
jgi:hypothetical protein